MQAQVISWCIKCADPLIHRFLSATGKEGIVFFEEKGGMRLLIRIEVLHEHSLRTLHFLETLREAGAECQGSGNIIFTSIHQFVTDPMETFCRIGRAEREENSFEIIKIGRASRRERVEIS